MLVRAEPIAAGLGVCRPPRSGSPNSSTVRSVAWASAVATVCCAWVLSTSVTATANGAGSADDSLATGVVSSAESSVAASASASVVWCRHRCPPPIRRRRRHLHHQQRLHQKHRHRPLLSSLDPHPTLPLDQTQVQQHPPLEHHRGKTPVFCWLPDRHRLMTPRGLPLNQRQRPPHRRQHPALGMSPAGTG